MPYLVTGNAQQIFHAFGLDWAVAEGKDDTGTIHLDFPRTHFLGSPEEAIKHFDIWNTRALGRYYLQGNMSAGNLHYLLGPNPLMKEKEDPESYSANVVRQHFAYMNDKGEPCGLMVMYRTDNPRQWIMGHIKNGHAAPKDRELTLLSSFDLAPFISVPAPKEPVTSSVPNSAVTVSHVDFLNNPFIGQIGANLPRSLLKNIVNAENGEINLRFQRVELMTRKLHVEQEMVTLSDPIQFSELNLAALFADNKALDLIIKYNLATLFPLSSTLLHDLLTDPSLLRQQIEAIQLTQDENRNKNLLKMILVFYKHGLLEKNGYLLNDPMLLQTYGSLMGDEAQIKLIPFLKNQKYPDGLMRQILSEPAYYKAIGMLVDLQPELTEDVPEFFKDSKKLEDLNFIHSLSNDDTKRLCLLFWVYENFSEDGYEQIITATNHYPLLASTLVALEQTKTKTIDQLQALALNPKEHLRKSILHHFREELNTVHGVSANLRQLPVQDLEAASESLILLKKSKITAPQSYRLVLDKESKGHALRLLLPQLAKIKNEEHRKALIEILLVGAKFNVESQDKRVQAIKGPKELKELAIDIHECFKCIIQLQDFKCEKEAIKLVAQKDSEEAKRFRQVILCIMEQCKVVDDRLSGSQSYRHMFLQWEAEQKKYRKILYQIAYEGLTNPNANIRPKLQEAEDRILAIVDPEIKSDVYKALIVFANIIITALSLSLANVIKYKTTGNFWFFNQTRSGEELRALDREIFELIAPEKNDEVGTCGILSLC
ncbi:hypothetical protein [Legionella longbeachae]|uniref:Uncharacterized protein n=1 Tax=Legionella longbeachae serogroup 1 (strain NSW150) TaxID=661367 RepID=D3HN20_LEGLN|nr:hypothetical protein [Legionella longbeachae]VEE04386.1 Uncharacterised protein [Legionella oakridgensis]ARB92794.1 hypothetical protein A6J40_11670 [Legionella longbeachae]EEZ96733.1 conserved hypothetical protein [Legionella longbeachae D-4968]QIN33945.1 hypothetical protein GCB94_18220 [Legionella longbeachae]QIN37281.1 hypothetical protein GCS73_17430 [Legionella longbeachae]